MAINPYNPNLHVTKKLLPATLNEPNPINWEVLALRDPEVCALLRSGFRFHTNYPDPEKISDSRQALDARNKLKESIRKLTTQFGLGAVYVINSAYCENSQPYKGGVAIWVCAIKPDVELEVPETNNVLKKPTERPLLLF